MGIIGKRCRLATTFVLDVFFDHIRRTSSIAKILLRVLGPVWSPFDWLRVKDRKGQQAPS
ncbi:MULTISPECIES: hypothetical protein [unclassified Bradyrhizobium]|uniref:hypothetical protein n=1 Tax=unclassified Bradyrhizobium TaxID=2631580 RepID=UPI003394DBEE